MSALIGVEPDLACKPAGIGIAVASRMWLIAVIATAGVLAVLWGLGYVGKLLERAWGRRRKGKN